MGNGVGREMGDGDGVKRKYGDQELELRGVMEKKPSVVGISNMKVTLVKLPNNEGDKVPISSLLLPREASSTGTRLHPIELLAKGVQWKSPHSSFSTN